MNILDLPMKENDSGAATIRGYLKALLVRLWEEDEGFSGKRPFGNSGWKVDLLEPLITAGLIKGELDEAGYITYSDDAAADALILKAIGEL